MCFSCCSWSFAHRRFRKANIVICDDMYSCNTYHVSIGSNGFWILRVTIYSRIHKSYAPPASSFPFFLKLQTPYSYTWDQENLDDDGFSHTLSTTPWVLNWKIPVVLLLQICRILGAAKSHQIELKEKSASYFPYHVFNFSCFHTHIGTFVPFSDHYTLCLKIIQKGLFFANFSWFFKRSFVSSNQCQTALIFSIKRAHFKAIL